MRAGTLRRQVLIQARTQAVDGFGQQSTAWSAGLSVSADIQQLQGNELLNAQAVNALTTHSVLIRYRTDVTAASRLVYQGRFFNVHSVVDPDTSHIALLLMCGEGMNQG